MAITNGKTCKLEGHAHIVKKTWKRKVQSLALISTKENTCMFYGDIN